MPGTSGWRWKYQGRINGFGAGRTHIQHTPKPAGSPFFVTCLLATFTAIFPFIMTTAGVALIVIADAFLFGITTLFATILADIAGVLAFVATPGGVCGKRGYQ